MKSHAKSRASRFLAIIGLAALLAAAATVVWRYARVVPGPSLLVEPRSRTLRAGADQSTVSATYAIRNVGSRTVELGSVSTSCGCSVASISKTRLLPGESSQVDVRGEPPGAGRKPVEIRVETSDPATPEVVLRLILVGSVETPYVAFHSRSIPFGRLTGSDLPAETDVLIMTREDEGSEPWLAGARTSVAGVEIEGGLDEEESRGNLVVSRSYRFRATLSGSPRPGPFHGTVDFLARGGGEPAISLPILGEVRPEIVAEPSTLYAAPRPGETVDPLRVELVSDREGADLGAIEPLEAPAGVQVRRVDAEGPRVAFEVRVDPDAVRGERVNLRFGFGKGEEGVAVEVPLVLPRTVVSNQN